MNKPDSVGKDRERKVLFKELGEKAERAVEIAFKKTERQDPVLKLDEELEWLAHSQFKIVGRGIA